MLTTQNPFTETPIINESSDWFDDIVSTLRSDQVKLAAGIADKETTELYRNFISGNSDAIFRSISSDISKFYISDMLVNFTHELVKRNAKPKELHVFHTINTLHVWAIIEDEDEITESALYLSEAFVNATNSKLGYSIDTMILESSDNYIVPNHYKKII